MVQIESKTTRNEETKGKGDGRERETQPTRGGRCSLAHARGREFSLSRQNRKATHSNPNLPGSPGPWLSGARESGKGDHYRSKTKDHRGCRNLIITGKGGRRTGNSASSSMHRMESLDQLPVIVSNTSEFTVQCHPRIMNSSTVGLWSSHVWGGRAALSRSLTL